jgi:hypothetical protein
MSAGGWQYRSTKPLVITLTILFGVLLILGLVRGACSLMECVELQKNLNANDEPDPNVPLALAHLCAGFLWGLFFLITAVVFCVWIYRANANARALGASDMSITPGWSAGWFFVPFANLVKPFIAVREIWNASDSDPRDVSASGGTPLIVAAWWCTWILTNSLGYGGARIALHGSAPKEKLLGAYLLLASDILEVGVTILVIGVGHGIGARQDNGSMH